MKEINPRESWILKALLDSTLPVAVAVLALLYSIYELSSGGAPFGRAVSLGVWLFGILASVVLNGFVRWMSQRSEEIVLRLAATTLDRVFAYKSSLSRVASTESLSIATLMMRQRTNRAMLCTSIAVTGVVVQVIIPETPMLTAWPLFVVIAALMALLAWADVLILRHHIGNASFCSTEQDARDAIRFILHLAESGGTSGKGPLIRQEDVEKYRAPELAGVLSPARTR